MEIALSLVQFSFFGEIEKKFITIYIIIYKKILSQIAIVIFAITSVYYKDIYLEHILSHEKTDVVIQILDIAHT